MASVNEPCDIRVVAEDPYGNQRVAHKFRSDGAINAGSSPDGVLANLTHDKQMKVGLAGPVMTGGWRVRLLINLDAADGIDVSDCIVQIPITHADGAEHQLGASDFGIATDIPAAAPAGSWFELGTGFAVPDGDRIRIGSGTKETPIVISIEDDTG